MSYIYYFDIAAIILTAMLILTVYLRKTFNSASCRCYKLLLWLNLISSVSDLASAFTLMYIDEVPISVNYLVNCTYLLSHNLTAVAFFIYLVILVRGDAGNKAERLVWQGAAVFVSSTILTTPITKAVIYFEKTAEGHITYNHGPLISVLYLFAFAFILYGFIIFLRHRELMTTFQIITNVSFLTLLAAAIIVQAFVTNVLIESFCIAVAFMMMNVALDNPATYFYRNTYCFNQTAFYEIAKMKKRDGVDMHVLAFTFDELSVFRNKYGEDAFRTMIDGVIKKLHGRYGQKRVYMLGNTVLALIDVPESLEETVETVDALLGREIRVGGELTRLSLHYCLYTRAESAETPADITETIETMLFDVYRTTGVRVIRDDTGVLKKKQRESAIIHRLRDAIAHDGFEMYYQPIYNVESGKFISAEALIRLKSQPEGDYIGPAEFIPIAEKNGMIFDIGEIVFEKVCRFYRFAELAKCGFCCLEVNLSMLELADRQSVENVEEYVRRYGLSPTDINIEITETASAAEEDKLKIQDNIAFLKEKGFVLSLDDYGSGYSTMSYLAEIPFGLVKIDKSILSNAMTDPAYATIMKNAIELSHVFGKQTVAEGVETQEMIDFLNKIGCDFHQGYFYSKPLPQNEFLAFIREKNGFCTCKCACEGGEKSSAAQKQG